MEGSKGKGLRVFVIKKIKESVMGSTFHKEGNQTRMINTKSIKWLEDEGLSDVKAKSIFKQ